MNGDIEFWTSHVEAVRREAVAASVYARRHGLTVASLYYWRRKLARTNAVTSASSIGGAKFVALRLVDGGPLAADRCTLVLGPGLRLELAELPSPAWLAAFAQASAGVR